MKLRSTLLIALSTGAAALLYACSGGGGEKKAAGGKGAQVAFPVETAPVASRTVEYAVTAVGSVDAFEKVQVTARVAGVVEQVKFVEGETVETGTPLVEIEPRRYQLAVEAARANVQKAEASKADAEAFLRKFARDTEVDRLHAWYNREVPRCLRSLRLFDEEGLFIGDGSYLFVPDNEHYEGSDLLWFDEHNHPVDSEKVDLWDQRYQQHRCYKLVSLIHINRQLDFFFTVAARVVPGRRHECPILYELVDEVVRAVGRDVIKVLILDRGFIDGAQMGRLQQNHRIETILPVRSNMDLHADALG